MCMHVRCTTACRQPLVPVWDKEGLRCALSTMCTPWRRSLRCLCRTSEALAMPGCTRCTLDTPRHQAPANPDACIVP